MALNDNEIAEETLRRMRDGCGMWTVGVRRDPAEAGNTGRCLVGCSRWAGHGGHCRVDYPFAWGTDDWKTADGQSGRPEIDKLVLFFPLQSGPVRSWGC